MKKTISIIVATTLVGFLIYGISYQKKEIPVESPGSVIATPAFGKYFGPAPTIDKGTAYAFVIYFPSAKIASKVVPFPFFSFDETSLKKVSVERLLSGMGVGSYHGEFETVPPGTRIVSFNDDQGTVRVVLNKEFRTDAKDKKSEAFAAAISTTLRQFKGVKNVSVQVEGHDQQITAVTDEISSFDPGPPRLLNVTAMRDKGAKNIEDVNAFFDRPVDVKELKLYSKDGQQYSGDLFHSVFDMAAVLKPKDPSQFKERTPIRVRWKIVDKLGRQAEGDNVWLLEVKQHEQ